MNFFRRIPSIRLKMLVVFLPIILIATLLLTTINFINSKNVVTYQIQERVDNKLSKIVEQMEHEFTAHKLIAEALGAITSAEGNILPKSDYEAILKKMVNINANTHGAGIWLEPYKYNKTVKYFGPYVYKDFGDIVYSEEYENATYDYPNTSWYKEAKQSKAGVVWTKPHFELNLAATLLTVAVPLRVDDEFTGVITADYDISTIQQIVLNTKFEKTGYAFLVDGTDGTFIAHKDQNKVMKQTIKQDKTFKELSQQLTKNKKGSSFLDIKGEKFEAFYTTLPSTGWKLVIVAPERELYSSIYDLMYKSIAVTLVILLISTVIIYMFTYV